MKTKFKSTLRAARHLFGGAALLAANTHAQSTTIVGDLQNPMYAIGRLPPDYGWAQQFTIASGLWNLTSAEVAVGDQYPGLPAVPVVQIRNAAAGSIPGNNILGTFTMNPDNIPAWEFGVEHIAPVSAPADSGIVLGPGTYWLCLMNFALPASQGEIYVGFANAGQTQQSGTDGNLVNVASLATWDGQNFSSGPLTFTHQTLLMELDGQPVPEPSALGLLAVGVTTLLVRRRRKQ